MIVEWVGTHGRSSPFVGLALVAVLVSVGVLVTGQISAASASVVRPAAASGSGDITAPNLRVLTIGDSIMNGHGLAEGQAWPFLLAAREGWTLTNAACDGAGVIVVGDPTECNSTFTGMIDSVSTLHPDIVILRAAATISGRKIQGYWPRPFPTSEC